MTSEEKSKSVQLIYDGECPFCLRYARYVRLKETIGHVELINARESENKAVKNVKARGFDLDQGMVAIIDEQYYHGSEALNILAALSSKSGVFNRLNYWIFRSSILSKALYPFLKLGRNMALLLKGSRQIKDDNERII